VDDVRFDAMVAAGEMLEWALVHGRRYGTSARQVQEIMAGGNDVLLDVDTQGARSVRALRPDSVFIFIMPPDYRTLEERLRGRGGASPEEVQRRIGNARQEMERYVEYDYVVINDALPEALGSLEAIVLGRRRRRPRMEAHCRKVMETFRSH
jgi:guanylate kinase